MNYLTNNLLTQDYDILVSQYRPEKLLNNVFEKDENGNSIIDFVRLLRFSFAFQFLPDDNRVALNNDQRKKIIELVALSKTLDINELQAQLSQIDQNLTVPVNFNFQQEQTNAIQILRSFDNINKAFTDSSAYDYLGDTVNLCKMPIEKIKSLRAQGDTLVQKINNEYRRIPDYESFLLYEMAPPLVGQITDFLRQIGRIKLFVSEEKERADIGQLLQILIKFGIAADIAFWLKSQPAAPVENLDEFVYAGIKNYLGPKISF